VKKSFLLACAIVCLSVPAFAQTQPPQPGPARGGYIAGIGGLTFGNESDKLYGGEIGVDATRNLTVYGSLGRMQNIAPKSVNDTLDVYNALLTLATGDVWEFKAKAPTFFGIGGLKYRVPTNSSVRPYVLGGAGIGSVKVHVTEARFGDITDALLAEGTLDQSDVKATKFLVEMGGGVEIPVGPMYVDTGYRFGKFVGLEDTNISRAYVGIGYRFGGSTK
jgi:opacity protein-like surface antigen